MTDEEQAPETDPSLTAAGAAVTGASAATTPPGLAATGAAVTGGNATLGLQIGLAGTGAAVTGGSATLTMTTVKEVAEWVVNHRLLLAVTVFLAVGSPIISWALSLWPALAGVANIVIGIALNVVAAVAGAFALSRVLRKRTVVHE